MVSGSLRTVRVGAANRGGHLGRLSAGPWSVPCALGGSGIRLRKREDDMATPAGVWPMRALLVRRDRLCPPRTGLPVFEISPDDGWCDDPADPMYNRPVPLPYPGRTESLWREDGIYDLVVVLGHNDSPPVPGRGSAIFFHLATPGFGPTAGCVAVERRAMTAILPHCGPATRLVVT